MAFDLAVLPVNGDAREVADVLIGSRQLIEQGRLTAVLIAHQCEGERRAVRQRIAGALRMEPSAFTKARVFIRKGSSALFTCDLSCSRPAVRIQEVFLLGRQLLHANLRRVIKTERQLIPLYLKFDGIAHRGVFHYGDFRARNHTHVEEVLPEGAFSADLCDDRGFTDA